MQALEDGPPTKGKALVARENPRAQRVGARGEARARTTTSRTTCRVYDEINKEAYHGIAVVVIQKSAWNVGLLAAPADAAHGGHG